MSNVRIESLTYRVEANALKFENPPPLEHVQDAFNLRLADGKLTVTFKEHHGSVASARQRVKPFLRSWELHVALVNGWMAVSFVWEAAVFVNLATGKPEVVDALTDAGLLIQFDVREPVHTEYPAPPSTGFLVNPDVETLWSRYEGYVKRTEPLTAMAYFCLTLLEARGEGRAGAAAMYRISYEVISQLGKLTSVRGDVKTGRKYVPEPRPLHPVEETWIEEVVKALIRRVGEHAGGVSPLREITLADFVPLPPLMQ